MQVTVFQPVKTKSSSDTNPQNPTECLLQHNTPPNNQNPLNPQNPTQCSVPPPTYNVALESDKLISQQPTQATNNQMVPPNTVMVHNNQPQMVQMQPNNVQCEQVTDCSNWDARKTKYLILTVGPVLLVFIVFVIIFLIRF